MKVKLCGFTEIESLKVAVENKCDFIGFVFHNESPRYTDLTNAIRIAKIIPNTISKVAVLVNSDLPFLEQVASELNPEYFQFHGDESIDYLKKVRKNFSQKIIKAVRISSAADLEQLQLFEEHCDLLLLDAKLGGGGKAWDWKILPDFLRNKNWILAGGLNSSNVESAIKTTGTKIVDISSGIEKIRGKKSPELITKFMEKIRGL